MPRASKVQPEQIEAARKILRELPAKEMPKSKKDAAKLLTKEFQSALKRGYSVKEISEILQAEGIGIPAAAVKSSLNERSGRTQKKEDEEISPTS